MLGFADLAALFSWEGLHRTLRPRDISLHLTFMMETLHIPTGSQLKVSPFRHPLERAFRDSGETRHQSPVGPAQGSMGQGHYLQLVSQVLLSRTYGTII